MVAETESGREQAGPECDSPSLTGLFRELRSRSNEIAEYTQYLIAIEIDRLLLRTKRLAVMGAFAALGAVIAGVILLASAALLIVGLAGVIGQALGSFWLGAIVVGAGVMLLLAASCAFGWWYLNHSALTQLRAKYQERRARQRSRFGRDIQDTQQSLRPHQPPTPQPRPSTQEAQGVQEVQEVQEVHHG